MREDIDPSPRPPRVRCATPTCETWLSRYRLPTEHMCEACRLAELAQAGPVINEAPTCHCGRPKSAKAKQCAPCAREETRQAWAAYRAREVRGAYSR
jgi:hypothetical protein